MELFYNSDYWNDSTSNKGKIDGIIIDENNMPIHMATVKLMTKDMRTEIARTYTKKTGEYEFDNIPLGLYKISSSIN